MPLLLLLACGPISLSDKPDDTDSGEPVAATGSTVEFDTSMGAFTVELDPENAPITTQNFLVYVEEGFYDGTDGKGATTFHRVISGFMNQGGGYTEEGTEKSTHAAIELEADNGLANNRGTIAMARTNSPDSATSQFFINTVDNDFLNSTGNDDGYAVFGEVTSGMDTIDAIAAVSTDGNDAPLETILITAATLK